MTERNLSELANAEIVPDMGGSNSWLVRFGENDYDTINKSGKNTLLVKGDVDITDSVTHDGITVDFDLEEDEIFLTDGENEVRVPAENHENVLWAVYDEDGFRLNKLHDELHVPTVRQGLMDMLMPRFRQAESDIIKTGKGWLIDDNILVGWDASNSPVDISETHVVSGGEAVPADEDKEAREIAFDLPDESTVALPNGTKTDLDEVEMKFLTTVGLIQDTPQTSLYDDGLADAIRDSRVVGFTDTESGLHHGHSIDKHRIQDLGVTDEAAERLWYNDYDHAGVWELALRKDEFINAPIDVFEDAPNHSEKKWQAIESTKENAPIPQHVRGDIEARYL